MKLKTTLFGNVYQFKDVKEVLAKANELRSGDVLAGVAAASSQERVAAKQVLSEMTVADIRNMKLKTTLFGNVYQFKDVKEVLAKAN
ncbi:ethanolamine ammonia-lyase subunit EutB, partial [Salmonella enterica]|uniref:ethanolamine ammonia-lyase subunit EutB n=1 Tax=Salmonella enterica TaxID=28901 RepID=UPI003F431C7C